MLEVETQIFTLPSSLVNVNSKEVIALISFLLTFTISLMLVVVQKTQFLSPAKALFGDNACSG